MGRRGRAVALVVAVLVWCLTVWLVAIGLAVWLVRTVAR